MSEEDFIINVFCLVEDEYKKLLGSKTLRQRGFAPALTDSEVITMEAVAEFLGMDTDKGCWHFFRTHYFHFFPSLGSRANFVKQAANLFAVKLLLREAIALRLGVTSETLHYCDGFPMPVCHFRRANFSQVFKGEASFGFCASKKETYYGFKGNLLIDSKGVISGLALTQAHIDERESLWDVLSGIKGNLIADKGLIGKAYQAEIYEHTGIILHTALRDNMHEDRSPELIQWLKSRRRLVETVIGQLTERFHIEKVRARKLISLINRTARKILSHTLACFINAKLGNPLLQFDRIIEY